MATPRAPFRADHVGSLLRPASLKALRLEKEAGRASAEALAAAEDAAVPAAPAGGGVRGWGRDGLGNGRAGKGREGAEGVDVDYAPVGYSGRGQQTWARIDAGARTRGEMT